MLRIDVARGKRAAARHRNLAGYAFGLAEIAFMGQIEADRMIFGPEKSERILGVRALESVGITIDPANRTLQRLPAVPLK